MTASRDDDECVFCAASRPASSALVLCESARAYVILNLYPYNSGHVMVVPRRHVGALAELDAPELSEVMQLTQLAELALTEAYTPQGLNVGINLGRPAGAGILDHLHVHLVPRWNGDTNFMSVVGDTRVLPEDLESSATRLRPVFARLLARRPVVVVGQM